MVQSRSSDKSCGSGVLIQDKARSEPVELLEIFIHEVKFVVILKSILFPLGEEGMSRWRGRRGERKILVRTRTNLNQCLLN